jgi:hypothetical protein
LLNQSVDIKIRYLETKIANVLTHRTCQKTFPAGSTSKKQR